MTGPLERFQRGFAAALISPDPKAVPDFLDGEAAVRFRIYRNNYFASLAGRLAEVFPVVRKTLGPKPFNTLVYQYACEHPPAARSLALFGERFSEFLKKEQTLDPPYAADLGALEFACHAALHAGDGDVLAPEKVAGLGAAVAETVWAPHPALRIVFLRFQILDLWRAGIAGTSLSGKEPEKKSCAVLITRPADTVMTAPLSLEEANFITSLAGGRTPLEAADKVGGGKFDFEGLFAKILAAGAFAGIRSPRRPRAQV